MGVADNLGIVAQQKNRNTSTTTLQNKALIFVEDLFLIYSDEPFFSSVSPKVFLCQKGRDGC